jgi:hypothetical protein
VLRPFKPNTATSEIRLTMSAASANAYAVDLSGVGEADAAKIKSSFEANELLSRVLLKKYFRTATKKNKIEVIVPIKEGRFAYSNIGVRMMVRAAR